MSAFFKRVLGCFLLLCPGWIIAGSGQRVDPFYLKMLENGKSAYQAREFPEAAKTLEVAVFGLAGDKKLAAEAYVYLSLAQANNGEKEKGRQALSTALQWAGERGFASIEFPGTVLIDLEAAFGPLEPLKNDQAREITDTALPNEEAVAPTQPKETLPRPSPEENNISLYYQQYFVHHRKGNLAAAKSILQALIRNNPKEADALYFLARIEFSRRNYEKALEYFNKAFNPAAGNTIGSEYVLLARIYTALCFFRLNMKDNTAAALKSLQEEYAETEITTKLKEEGLEGSWRLMQNRLGDH